MSKEFYQNLSLFFNKTNGSDIADDYEIDIDDETLNKEYIKILPGLDDINAKLDLSHYLN